MDTNGIIVEELTIEELADQVAELRIALYAGLTDGTIYSNDLITGELISYDMRGERAPTRII